MCNIKFSQGAWPHKVARLEGNPDKKFRHHKNSKHQRVAELAMAKFMTEQIMNKNPEEAESKATTMKRMLGS